MKKTEIADLLTVIAVGDGRTILDKDVEFWWTILGDLPKDLALIAVRDHFREEPGVWLEPGHVSKRVKALRQEALAREPEYPVPQDIPEEEPRFVRRYPGDAKAAPEPADYPREWTSDQRLDAYWYAIKRRVVPATTKGWVVLLDELEELRAERVSTTESETSTEEETSV